MEVDGVEKQMVGHDAGLPSRFGVCFSGGIMQVINNLF